ncbi:hypothetical protein HNR00_003599 [Methylorubrum rhodinum]|uniref:Uncharacterized protein n=1 Tax=Methylorubrum rhodinum TaxID=29428 RepID=A0A840ZL80_9HYPH|nr:glycosyltransferase [Methylorubrum rhodinum]MBB5758872.1 hypothetical protein [Methylorubrum rhodinum]
MSRSYADAPQALTAQDVNSVKSLIAMNIRSDENYGQTDPGLLKERSITAIGEGRLKHYIITRFNLWDENLRRAAGILEEDAYLNWIERRIVLFRESLLPTLVHQTYNDFQLLLFFDTNMDSRTSAFIESLQEFGFIKPLFVDFRLKHGWSHFENTLAAEILSSTVVGDVVATTRIDSDDALSIGFMQNLNQYCSRIGYDEAIADMYVNFPFGLQCTDRDIRILMYNRNPFQTMLEAREKYLNENIWVRKGVFQTAHDRTFKVGKIINVITSFPMWAQFVHGGNVANHAKASLPIAVHSDPLRIMFANTLSGGLRGSPI